jgi:DNA-binding IclR family transcriptional regulator
VSASLESRQTRLQFVSFANFQNGNKIRLHQGQRCHLLRPADGPRNKVLTQNTKSDIYKFHIWRIDRVTSIPTERTLQVLEYLMAAGSRPVKQVDIARDCGIAPATLNRIIQALSDRGYLFRTSEKYCVPNFRLERRVPMSDRYLALLDRQIKDLSLDLEASAEVVVVVGQELLWLNCSAHPDPDVRIRAKVGFRRGLYELDALSQIYLGHLTKAELKDRFFTEGFFKTEFDDGRRMNMLTEAEAQRQIRAAGEAGFAYDPTPNHQGIRRFAMAVTKPGGEFMHLISVADKVRPDAEEAALVARLGAKLREVQERLDAVLAEETAQHPEKYVSLARSATI